MSTSRSSQIIFPGKRLHPFGCRSWVSYLMWRFRNVRYIWSGKVMQ